MDTPAYTGPAGQLSDQERQMLVQATLDHKPGVVLEVGTWLGGGSTIHILNALEKNGRGHLWGIESVRSIYEKMMENIRQYAPQAWPRFTPLFGRSDEVIPPWLEEQAAGGRFQIDLAFLDGGDNPLEQILEFKMIDPFMPVGSLLFAHDAKRRKAKWLVPYLRATGHWDIQIHDSSSVGMLSAVKKAAQPGAESLRQAEADLARRKWEPVEVIGRFLPSALCAAILRFTPQGVRRRLGQPGPV